MFEVMREYGPVIGIDVSERAAGICRAKGYRAVTIGSVDNLPLVSSSLWMIGLTDVLEHIEDDRKALLECARVLEPRGVLLVTVPACRWLYGEHDQALGHFRRYSAQQMKGLLEQCGFRVTRMTHYNTLLFPLVSATRIVSRALRGRAAQADPLDLPDPLNWFAHMMLQAERLLLSRGNLPFGLSLLCVATKEPQPAGASGRPLGPLA
jgi:SAM-dependent methyltransferase